MECTGLARPRHGDVLARVELELEVRRTARMQNLPVVLMTVNGLCTAVHVLPKKHPGYVDGV